MKASSHDSTVSRPPSRSAALTAAARAVCREDPEGAVLDDSLAADLAGTVGAEMIERARATMTADEVLGFCRWVCVRARFAEDMVEEALDHHVEQYVILGAGLDSYAYTRGARHKTLRVFEVDHPASQAWKRGRLRDIGVPEPLNLAFAPVDFERETLEDGLRGAGFDFDAPAAFAWIGVTMYLTSAAITSTLRDVASSAPGSRLVMTYNLPDDAVDEFSRRVTGSMRALVTNAGEPFISLFTPAEIERLVAEHGFTRMRHFGADDARQIYFNGRADVAIGAAQRVLVADLA